ncbi:N(5),N(10)-methenyltetrahydromethanopterin cyclohydrolase [candidate division MSBL1 archaeon SCGC-AAA259E19]|uniref:Methenyltetrahydromethanopterin cyclohydrolase n=2 Tax=candidate division MSBL1 TaxID=215777 RepID=A0A133UAA6_9EURY|nr:N(5),N(10)-methenyltetrahydromethanopterin cyclohydrolase [candidate division MSBL1 archaeon SCGC-AAA259E17]KXA95045.1 N(5),N(10)-methenyltetrahydromethanopterin cyclohydrolase [candidate division MSBL1 archaeon SCGC-AAA259E19]
MISVNDSATALVDEMIEKKEVLSIDSLTLENGTKVIDAGVNVNGGAEAGKYLTKVCLGGLAEIHLAQEKRTLIRVHVDHPAIACMASQYAGWSINVGNFSAMGSGPARALSQVEDLYDDLDYQDDSDSAVLVLETRNYPNEEVAEYITEKCGVETEDLYLLVSPTASIVGSVQISGRVVETGVHKLHELDFDIKSIVTGIGSCPVSPVASNDLEAMGQTNDCVLYGGRTIYFVEGVGDEEIEEIIEKVPSSASEDYGKPFLELFEEYERDFFKIDPHLFSPAQITINNIETGSIFKAGEVNENLLEKSLGI